MADYERIRAAEGRGSESKEFYLGLPYNGLPDLLYQFDC
jgi:hypothetical protein